jgi:type III pantothenate kinase
MSILLIDRGNTRLKWQLRKSGAVEATGVDDNKIPISEVLNELTDVVLSGIYVASVADVEFENECSAWAVDHAFPVPFFIKSVKEEYGVTNGYDNTEQLGVDRWLAMIAAHNKFDESLCVVDVGTALTIDFILKNGQHMGGFIVPGPQLQIQSLLKNTQKIELKGQLSNGVLGKNTREAVELGVINMLGAFIKQSVMDAKSRFSSPIKLVLTGGAATQIMPAIGIECSLEENLIFDGIAMVAANSK